MKSRSLLLWSFFSILGISSSFSQNNFFHPAKESTFVNASEKRIIVPTKYLTYTIDTVGLKNFLSTVPMEFTEAAKNNPVIMELPMPDGSFQHFSIVEAPIQEPELAAKFPDIKTYGGQGIEDKTATLKMDWTAFGFHSQIRSALSGSSYVDPYARYNKLNYIIYDKGSLVPRKFSEIGVLTEPNIPQPQMKQFPGFCYGTQLRTMKLAVTNTGEYAAAVGGTSASLLHSAIVTSVNRVAGVYETEVAVRMILVANNNLIEFLDASTDPYTQNNNGSGLLAESQTSITTRIGSANYNIGHIFSTGGGGIASLGSVCISSRKAQGVTGLPNPVGDAYDIDFVAHEMGHQFGGNHPFNCETGNCGGGTRNASTAVEPGSGITIMGYAGICTAANDDSTHSIAYFHTLSMYEIGDNFVNGFGTCPVITATGNHAPVVNAGADYTIPVSTPFTLTGSATDADGDALTYSWEENDIATAPGNWNSGSAPFFRSFNPVTWPSRTFPKIADILANKVTSGVIGEKMPTTGKTMNFRLTVRDNKLGGGGVCNDDVVITSTGTAPFIVTSQASVTAWVQTGSSTAVITWNVVNTAIAPISCSNVAILFSTDGGLTFPITLLASTPNIGTATITIPSLTTTTGRVKVAAIGNVFFNINKAAIKVSTTLPVQFTELLARKNGDKVVLSWETLSEQNSATFEVERSANGKEFTTVIGSAKAAGNSSSTTSYSLIDAKPLTTVNYYRVKQIDLNGKFTYSNIAAVRFDKNTTPVLLYPNPSTKSLNMEFNSTKDAIVRVRVVETSGAVVLNKYLNANTGTNIHSLNIEGLSSGSYILELIDANGVSSFSKFVKQ